MIKQRGKHIFETPSKVVYEGTEPETLVQFFRDLEKDGTFGNGRGVLNNRISEYFYRRLDDIGLPVHFIRRLNMREQLVRQVEYLPIAIMIRNMVDGNLANRLGLTAKTRLHRPIVELYLNDPQQPDPLVTEEHIANFGWIAPQDLDEMLAISARVHDLISGMLMAVGYNLVDIRLEFGRHHESHSSISGNGDDIREEIKIVLCSDLSPDTIRFFDRNSSCVLPTTGFEWWREHAFASTLLSESGTVTSCHSEIASRLGIMPSASAVDIQGPSTLQ